MNPKIKYTIVFAETLPHLQTLVNAAIDMGYIPVGGPFHQQGTNLPNVGLAQAMTICDSKPSARKK